MGAVFLGEHAILGRAAAIKVLRPELSQRRDVVARFFNEARATTAIRHPGIVELYDFGFLPDGAAYIVMEFLQGESLAVRLRRVQRFSVPATIQVGRQIAAALQAAHDKAITHRDLKPDNAFLVPDPEIGERVKLLDFGIAKLAGDDQGGLRTQTGMVMGTPVYMSPEQCRGAADLDHRADLYSLGCMLYEFLAGRPPFTAESSGELIAHHLYFPPEPLRRHASGVPESFEQLIMALLSKDPALRPATASAVIAALDQLAHSVATAPSVTASVVRDPVFATPVPAFAAPGAQPPRTVPGTPTTLSGSASAAIVPRPRRRLVWAAGGVAIAAAVGVLAVVAGSSSPSGPVTESPPAPTSAAVVEVKQDPPAREPETQPAPMPVDPVVAKPTPAPEAPHTPAPEAPHAPAPEAKLASKRDAKPARKASASTAGQGETKPTTPSEAQRATPSEAKAATPGDREVEAAGDRSPGNHADRPEVESAAPSGSPAPAATSKWGRRLGDKSSASVEIEDLLRRGRDAAAKGDCELVRSIVVQIRTKDLATYGKRVITDPAIGVCLPARNQ